MSDRRLTKIFSLRRVYWLVGAACLPGGVMGSMVDEEIAASGKPKTSWMTQPAARVYHLSNPAPRGIIVDRNGEILANNKLSRNLAIVFPDATSLTDGEVLRWGMGAVRRARELTGLNISLEPERLLRHYTNRGMLPLVIAEDVPSEVARIAAAEPSLDTLYSYTRVYPKGVSTSHVVGYVGREAPWGIGMLDNGDLLFPRAEGRDGVEMVFNDVLRGQEGTISVTHDPKGGERVDKVLSKSVPGKSVILAIDIGLQQNCVAALRKAGGTGGAVVIMDVQNGDILAMASHPAFDPNIFATTIDDATFSALANHPQTPLFPRTFRGGYPMGSVFKTFVGLGALSSGIVSPSTRLGCPSKMKIGNLWFRNHNGDQGQMTFREALAQSCNTWFYEVGLQMGATDLVVLGKGLGFGSRTGVQLPHEGGGRFPDNEYMYKQHGRRILPGDVANISIGQGDILATPLQLARAMAALGNGGVLLHPRIVKQVQDLDNKVTAAFPRRETGRLLARATQIDEVLAGLEDTVFKGTGRRAAIKGVKVGGKTGTAQWGPNQNRRNVAWFAGLVPIDNPRYAFAIAIEGAKGQSISGGKTAASLVPQIFQGIKWKDEVGGAASSPANSEEVAENGEVVADVAVAEVATGAGGAADGETGDDAGSTEGQALVMSAEEIARAEGIEVGQVIREEAVATMAGAPPHPPSGSMDLLEVVRELEIEDDMRSVEPYSVPPSR